MVYDPTNDKINNKHKIRNEIAKLERQKIGETANINRIKNLLVTQKTALRSLKRKQNEIQVKLDEKANEIDKVEKEILNLKEMVKNNNLKKEALAREAHLFRRLVNEAQPGVDEVENAIKRLEQQIERMEAKIRKMGDDALNLRRMSRKFN
jgi:chromosome segregation ATPase